MVRIESNAKSNKTIIAKLLQKIKTAHEQEFKRFFDIKPWVQGPRAIQSSFLRFGQLEVPEPRSAE